MQKATLWSGSVPRVELDQRVREARLRHEHVQRLLAPRLRARSRRLRRGLRLLVAGLFQAGGGRTGMMQDGRTGRGIAAPDTPLPCLPGWCV
jgi:hypothetical protein